jgi:integrase-like protein
MRSVVLSSRWIATAEAPRLRAFPATDLRYGTGLAARQVPRDHWRHASKWGHFSRPFCQTYRHRPGAAKSLQVFIGKLTATGQTVVQRAQAPCAVEDDAVGLPPEAPAWRDGDAITLTAPPDGDEGREARKPDSGSGHSRMLEAHVPVPVQAKGSSEQTNAAWRAVATKLSDDIRLRHDSPKTLQAYAGWMRQFRGFMVKTHPAELRGEEAKRFLADLAGRRQVSASAQNPAFNALRFLLRKVATKALGILRRRHGPSAARRSLLADIMQPFDKGRARHRCASAAAGSGSEARADAGGSRLRAFVRLCTDARALGKRFRAPFLRCFPLCLSLR